MTNLGVMSLGLSREMIGWVYQFRVVMSCRNKEKHENPQMMQIQCKNTQICVYISSCISSFIYSIYLCILSNKLFIILLHLSILTEYIKYQKNTSVYEPPTTGVRMWPSFHPPKHIAWPHLLCDSVGPTNTNWATPSVTTAAQDQSM